jgi:hypothetical protein
MNAKNLHLYILAGIIIAGTVVFLALLAVRETPAANKDAIMMALGAQLAAFGTVVGYFFGSSKGSADKTEALTRGKETTP